MFDTYYGSYRTRTFADIFPSSDAFTAELAKTPFAAVAADFRAADIPDTEEDYRPTLEIVFALLYARFGNSHISFSDENQFRYNIFSTLYSYGPTWAKKTQIQKELRALDATTVREGAFAIYNSAMNPNTQPSTQTLTELPFINNQNTTRHKKGLMDGYALLISLLEDNITKDFTDKFKRFFIQIIAPDRPLLYATYPTNETED
jgi:hypothetical protein